MEPPGGVRIEGGQLRMERGRSPLGRHGVQTRPQRRIGGWRRVEAFQEGPDVESRAPHHHGQPAAPADSVDAGERLPSEARGVIALVGLDDVEEMVRHGRLLGAGRLPGGHVHAAIDLARVGTHHLDREACGKVEGGRGLSHSRGPADDEKRRRGYHVRRSSRLISLRDSRETMGRPWGQKYGVSVAERSARSRVISSRCSGACAFTAARQATKARARSTIGESGLAAGAPTSSSKPSMRRRGSAPLRRLGTARRSTLLPPKSSRAKPRFSRSPCHSARSAAFPGSSSRDWGKRRAWEASGPAASSCLSCSKSTRSWATCWSTKNTSSSLAETTNVSWSWPITLPNRPGPKGAMPSRKSAPWMSAGDEDPETISALPQFTDGPADMSPTMLSPGVVRPAWGWTTRAERSASWTARKTASWMRRGERKRTHALVGWTLTSTSGRGTSMPSTATGNWWRASMGR